MTKILLFLIDKYCKYVFVLFLLLTTISPIGHAQISSNSNKTLTQAEMQKARLLIENNKTFDSDNILSDTQKNEFQNFYLSNNIDARVATKLNTLAFVPFNTFVSAEDRLLVCEYLIFMYQGSNNYFPLNLLKKQKLALTQLLIINKNDK